jgi:hypothetical protein
MTLVSLIMVKHPQHGIGTETLQTPRNLPRALHRNLNPVLYGGLFSGHMISHKVLTKLKARTLAGEANC